ncbi:MAG: glycosyltransferase [Phormidesmis sp.]
MGLKNTRLLIVVESADYRDALSSVFMPERLNNQLSGQLSPVDIHILTAAVKWSAEVQEVGIFSCYSNEQYSELTYLNVRIMGSGVSRADMDDAPRGVNPTREMVRLIADFCPDRLVLCTCSPTISPVILKWTTHNRIASLALFSDWQEPRDFWQRWRHRSFVRRLNRKSVTWVGANGVETSKALADSGIHPSKLIPWEWSQPQLLMQYPPKQMRDHYASIELVFVGQLDEQAGMEDLFQATLQLRRSGYTVGLHLIRNTLNYTSPVESYETAWLETRVQQLELADSVTVWAGLAPEQMLEQVRSADLAIIPQPPPQPDIAPPLGVSLAMAARTPIVACDHKNLDAHLLHSVNSISFPVGNPRSMAHRIDRIMGQSALYAQLSEASVQSLRKLKVPACWEELIERWMRDSAEETQHLQNFALSSGRYQPVKLERQGLKLLAQD